MKKLLYILLLIAPVFATLSCKKSKDEDKSPFFSIGATKIALGAHETSATLTISTNVAWTATVSDSWCTPNSVSADGSKVITINVTKNTSLEPRKANIKFTYSLNGAEKSTSLEIYQYREKPKIVLAPDSIPVVSAANVLKLKLSSNIKWTITNPTEYSWLSIGTPYAMVEKTIDIAISENPNLNFRSAKIQFVQTDSINNNQTLFIYQRGKGDINSDKAALIDLYNATNGPAWKNKWDLSRPIETWYGVTVSQTDLSEKRVTSLILSNNNLEGTIPASITTVDYITNLELNGNTLSGPIPASITKMAYLQYLYLHNNQLTGSIPADMGNLAVLYRLYLSNNKLSGAIPESIGNLSGLVALGLSGNDLTGSLPQGIGNLKLLKLLYLQNNRLTGEVPASFTDNTLWYYWQPAINICPQQSGFGFKKCN